MTPGNKTMAAAFKTPSLAASSASLSPRGPKPSTGIAMINIAINMTGARKKIDEKGLDVAGFRRSKICVSDQRSPERAEASITRKKPIGTNFASPATIITTPTVMTVMIPTSFQVIFSSRKMKAKIKTKANADDLHMAWAEC